MRNCDPSCCVCPLELGSVTCQRCHHLAGLLLIKTKRSAYVDRKNRVQATSHSQFTPESSFHSKKAEFPNFFCVSSLCQALFTNHYLQYILTRTKKYMWCLLMQGLMGRYIEASLSNYLVGHFDLITIPTNVAILLGSIQPEYWRTFLYSYNF